MALVLSVIAASIRLASILKVSDSISTNNTCYDGQVEITEEEYNRLQNNSSSTYITKKSDEEEKSIINFLNVFDLNYRTINFLENSTIVQLLDVEFEDI